MDPSQAIHAYEKFPLFISGLLLAVWLIGLHSLMLIRADTMQAFLKKFPRHHVLGQVLLAVGLLWFWLIVAPPGDGVLHALAMDLGDQFNALKPILRLVVPVSIILLAISIKEFLAVRALGLLGLMAAAPLLESAFLKDPASRLLVPIFSYVMIVVSLYLVGMPYLFRDAVNWVSAKPVRWRAASGLGLVYGVAVLICALMFWRGY